MNRIEKSRSAKILSGLVGIAMVWSVVFVPSANAATVEELTAQIQSLLSTVASLQAQLAGVTGGSTTGTGFTFTKNLQLGSTGEDVRQLQKVLNMSADTQVAATGAGSKGNETTTFGPMTKAAVIKFQNKYKADILTPVGLTSGTGFVGVSTRAKLNQLSGTGTSTGTTTPTGTGLQVTLDSSSPAQGAVVAGQALANLGNFRLTNTSGVEATVTALEFSRIGLSSDSTLSNVYLFSGASRISDAAAVSSGKITFNNTAGIVKIPAGSSVVISVQSDIAASTAGQIVGVRLDSVTSNVTAAGLPVSANVQSIASATIGTVSFTYNGPTGVTENPANEVRVFEAQANVSTNAARLESLTLENRGTSSDGDIRNLKLFVDGVQVGQTVAQFTNDRATFDLRTTPVTLNTGTRAIKVLADIVGGSSETYDIQIRRAADVRVVDTQVGQPILTTDTGGSFPVSGNANTISGGSLSVSRATNSPSGNIAVGSTNVKLATFDFRAAGEDIKIEAVTVDMDTTGTVGTGLDNGKVFVNGVQVGSTQDISASGTEFTFGSSFIAKAGAVTTVEIYADAKTSTSTNYASSDTIDVGVSVTASDTEGMISGDSIASNISEVEGNTRTITSSTLTASKASGYGNQTMVAGTNNAKIGSFTLAAGSTEGVNINTIVVDLSSANAASITDLMLKDASSGAQIGTTKSSPSSSNTFSVNLPISVSGTKTIDVYANIKSGSDAGTIALTVDSSTGGTGAVTANSVTTGSDVTLQTITLGSGSLTAAVSANDPADANVIAGSTGVKAGQFTFTAQNSSFTVEELAVKVPANAATSVSNVTLRYKNSAGTTVSQSQALTLSSGAQTDATATFTGLSFFVPANGTADLEVLVDVPTISSGATSGSRISVDVDYNSSFKARSAAGTESTSFGSADLSSNAELVVRKSIPTITRVASGTSVPATGVPVYKFTVAADSAGTVEFKQITLNVATSGVTISDMYIRRSGETTNLNDTAVNADANSEATFLIGAVDDDVEQIGAGSSKTYEIHGTVTGWGTSGDSLVISLDDDDSSFTANATANSLRTSNSIVWSDVSTIPHTTATSDWTNGYLLKDLANDVTSYSI